MFIVRKLYLVICALNAALPCRAQDLLTAKARDLVQVDVAFTKLPACLRRLVLTDKIGPLRVTAPVLDSIQDLDLVGENISLFYRWYPDHVTWIVAAPETRRAAHNKWTNTYKLDKYVDGDSAVLANKARYLYDKYACSYKQQVLHLQVRDKRRVSNYRIWRIMAYRLIDSKSLTLPNDSIVAYCYGKLRGFREKEDGVLRQDEFAETFMQSTGASANSADPNYLQARNSELEALLKATFSAYSGPPDLTLRKIMRKPIVMHTVGEVYLPIKVPANGGALCITWGRFWTQDRGFIIAANGKNLDCPPQPWINVPYIFFAPDSSRCQIKSVNGIPWNEYKKTLCVVSTPDTAK